uniref:Biogenesis of lysosome-related organelles complex 1 subunit 4-like n=1 Tax=Ciona intestinalis TaxID=7719 RepID=F6PXZ5_CIOIN|nr:biogenesis of lysosome-related organelles complex 1 subunit 4-like [Ciona intestinalis]|eukprot:XP_002130369.1 biogenesis of lysosome-related organelles complex 1 subunit 4-like [Ciona intestinalis]
MAAPVDHEFNKDMVERTAADFATLFSVTSQTNMTAIEESMEAVMTRLDELYGMLDMIRTDSTLATTELLPAVRAKMDALSPLFHQIDQLEKFVETVYKSVTEMEKAVKVADSEFSTLNSIKKVVSGFSFLGIGKKTELQRHNDHSNISIPEAFVPSEYLNLKSADSSKEINESAE